MNFFRKIQRIAALLSCLALLSASGGCWVILQSVAWAQMWVRYSRTETVAKAAVQTFDGKHPCAICKRIVRAKSKEKELDWSIAFQKFSVTRPTLVQVAKVAFTDELQFQLERYTLRSLAQVAPPTPPPQLKLHS